MLTMFKAFLSTVSPYNRRPLTPQDKILVDPVTGAPVGFANENANGPDARFIPVDITQAQLNAPTALMIADIDAVYRLNTPPYPRFYSDGSQLAPFGSSETETIVAPGINVIYYDPLKIAAPDQLIIQGTVRVQAYPT